MNKNAKINLAIASFFLIAVIFFFLVLPLIKSDTTYPSSMSVRITTPLETSQIKAYGSDYAVVNTTDGTTQVIFYSGQIATTDANGTYVPFTNLSNVTYDNYYLNISFPDGNYITYIPYITVSGSAEQLLSSFVSSSGVSQKVYIYDNGGSFKFAFNLSSLGTNNVTSFRLNRVATSYVAGSLDVSSGNSIKFGSNYVLDLTDLTDSTFTISSLDQYNIIIGNTSENIAGGTLVLDPTITLQTAGTQNLKDSQVWQANANINYGNYEYFTVGGNASQTSLTYITFNLSGFPSSSLISSSNLSLFMENLAVLYSTNISVYYLYNGWTNGTGTNELNETQITWNNQPCGTDFSNSTNCNLTALDTKNMSQVNIWYNWYVGYAINYSLNNKNVSLVLRNTTISTNYKPFFNSKEFVSSPTLRPKLIIDYTLGNATNTSCGYVNSDLNLSANISNLYGDCLIVNASNVVIDCQGYWISATDGYGLNDNGFNYTTLKNCKINTSGQYSHAIWIFNSSNDYFYNLSLFTYGYASAGVYILSTSSNNTLKLINSQNYGSPSYGVYNGGDSYNTISSTIINDSSFSSTWSDIVFGACRDAPHINHLNITFNNVTYSSENFYNNFGSASCKLWRNWYADAYVNDTGGNALNNSNVTTKDVTGTLINWSLSNSSGYTPRLILLQYTRNYTGAYYSTNYSMNATKTGYQGIATSVNLTTNRLIGTNPVVVTMTILAPTPTFVTPTPTNLSWQKYNFAYINITTDLASDACNLTWNGTNIVMSKTDSTHFYKNQTSQPDGTHTYNVSCNSSASAQWGTSETRVVYLDTTIPQISFTSNNPANASYQANTYANIIVSLTELHRDNLILSWNGTTNITGLSCTGSVPNLICNYNKTGLSNGVYTYYVWVNDTANNVNFTETRTLTVDTSLPAISFISPTPNDNTFSANSFFGVNVSITNADNYKNHTYYLYNYSGIYNTTNYSTKTNTFINYTSLAEGPYWYNATVCNLASSCSSTSTQKWTYDATDPKVNFTSTAPNNENQSSRTVTIIVNYTEANPSTAFLNFTNATGSANRNAYNYSFPPGTNVNMTFTLYSVPTGNWSFYVWMNDTSGRTATTETRWVNINATSPSIVLVTPTNPTYSNISSVNFTCNTTSVSTQLVNLSLYSNFTGSWAVNQTVSITGLSNQTQFNKTISDGNYVWNCQACDANSDCDYYGLNYSLTVDTTKPNISYNANTDLTNTYTINYIFVNVSATSSPSAINDVIISWDSTNYSKSNGLITCDAKTNGYDCYKNFTSLSDDIYSMQAFTSDMAGNTNNTTIQTYTIDYAGPTILMSAPTDSQTLSTNVLPYTVTTQFTITDGIPISACWYNVTDLLGNAIVASTTFACTNTSETFPINTAGSYYLNMYANTTNQQNSINRLFLVSFSTSPSQGGGAPPETNTSCICGNHVCEASCGENTLTCQIDCSQVNDLNTILSKYGLILLLVAALIVVIVILVRRKKHKRKL